MHRVKRIMRNDVTDANSEITAKLHEQVMVALTATTGPSPS